MEAETDCIFLGFKITADSDCSHEIKRCLLLGRIAMINPDSVLERRDIILLTNFCIVFFIPAVMYRCESCTMKRLSVKKLILSSCAAGEDS